MSSRTVRASASSFLLGCVLRSAPWTAFWLIVPNAVTVAASEATAASSTSPGSSTAPGSSVCWLAPTQMGQMGKTRMERLAHAVELAANDTRPKHVADRVVRIQSESKKSEGEKLGCRIFVDVTTKPTKNHLVDVLITATKIGASLPVDISALTASLDTITNDDLAPAWLQIWERISPPPPPEPQREAREPLADQPFVDLDLVHETSRPLAPLAGEAPPLLSVLFDLGLFSRTIDLPIGSPLEDARLLSIGGEATVHLETLVLGVPSHDLEVSAGYLRRLATANRGSEEIPVTADRLSATAVFRCALGGAQSEPARISGSWLQDLPRVGPLLGYELLRFEVGSKADALSVRYGVLRLGVSSVQDILRSDLLAFAITFDAALRISPGGDGGDAALSFDLGGGPELRLPAGPLVRLVARYTRQTGRILENDFTDAQVDLGVRLGWAL